MAGVNVPQRQAGLSQSVLPVAGSILGGMVGGPPGAAVGGQLGGMAAASAAQGGGSGAVEQKQSGDGGAMSRRLQTTDPQQQLAQAQQALSQLPQSDQQRYGPAIAEAQRRAAMGGNV